MKLHVLAYKDNALGCFTNPFFNDVPVENIKVGCTRGIVKACQEGKGANFKHKVLYKIGEFDDVTGLMIPCDHELLVDADEVIASTGE